MIFPIYIPSKGRAGRASSVKLFVEAGITPTLFVEPKERTEYEKHYGLFTEIVTIDKDNGGMAYVRNFMAEYAVTNRKVWTWQVDDDMTGLYIRVNKRMVKLFPHDIVDRLGRAEVELTVIRNLAFACLDWRNTAWCNPRDITYDRKCGLFTLVHNYIVRRDYEFRGILRSDIDMAMQLLSDGYRTATLHTLAFSAPGCGQNRVGGLSKQYDMGSTEHKAVQAFVDRWKPWASPRTTKAGRPDVKINWKQFLADHAKA